MSNLDGLDTGQSSVACGNQCLIDTPKILTPADGNHEHLVRLECQVLLRVRKTNEVPIRSPGYLLDILCLGQLAHKQIDDSYQNNEIFFRFIFLIVAHFARVRIEDCQNRFSLNSIQRTAYLKNDLNHPGCKTT